MFLGTRIGCVSEVSMAFQAAGATTCLDFGQPLGGELIGAFAY